MTSFANRTLYIDGLEAAYIEGGEGYPLLLLHGSGPGASTSGNWSRVLEPLAASFHVHAMDLIGFGRSDRKHAEPFFDLDLWLRQAFALGELMPEGGFGVIGHSISATLALRLAAGQSRVSHVLTTGAMGAPFQVNEGTIACWTFPETVDELKKAAGYLISDKLLIDKKYLDDRISVLHQDPAYKGYFSKMFSGDRQRYADLAVLDRETLGRVTCPVTMLHGRDDLAFPPDISLALAESLPQADVHLYSACSHSVALERAADLVDVAHRFFPLTTR